MKPLHIVLLFLISQAIVLAEEQPPENCSAISAYGMLDFWLGEWDVYNGGQKLGENRIEKILGGCAVLEHWTGTDGGKGKSLFYIDDSGTWQQVWVTEWATRPGGVKEKAHVRDLPEPAIRFQGEVRHPERGIYLDRTTLTPLNGGNVRQLIEISTDGGKTWETTFDAVYRSASGENQ